MGPTDTVEDRAGRRRRRRSVPWSQPGEAVGIVLETNQGGPLSWFGTSSVPHFWGNGASALNEPASPRLRGEAFPTIPTQPPDAVSGRAGAGAGGRPVHADYIADRQVATRGHVAPNQVTALQAMSLRLGSLRASREKYPRQSRRCGPRCRLDIRMLETTAAAEYVPEHVAGTQMVGAGATNVQLPE